MDILTPPRIESLDPQPIRVVEHSPAELKTWELPDVYPFDTILMLKQRIALHHDGNRAWLPANQFIAMKKGDAWRPLEFLWPFGDDRWKF